MRQIQNYVTLIDKVFGIEGLMAMAWYGTTARHKDLEELRIMPPHLIVRGGPHAGKTELAQAIASVSVSFDKNLHDYFKELPTMDDSSVKEVMLSPTPFSVFEGLRASVQKEVIQEIQDRNNYSPQLLITCMHQDAWYPLSACVIVIDMPSRNYTPEETEYFQMLKGAERIAGSLRIDFYTQIDNLKETYDAWRDKLQKCIMDESTFEMDDFCSNLINYYAVMLANWECTKFGVGDMLERLEEYAVKSIFERLEIEQKLSKRKTKLHRIVNEDGSIKMKWQLPEQEMQSMYFENKEAFDAFANMLQMLHSSDGEKLEICL